MPGQNRRLRPCVPPSSPPSAPPHYMMHLDGGHSNTSSPLRHHSWGPQHNSSGNHSAASGPPIDPNSEPPPRYDEAISDTGRGRSPAPFQVIWLAEQNRTQADDFRHGANIDHHHRALPSSSSSSSTFQQPMTATSPAHRRQRAFSSRNQSQPPSGCEYESSHQRQSNSFSDGAGSSSGAGGNGRTNNRNARYRSASPSGISNDSQDRAASSAGSNKKTKKNRGSKIKKGLENIAFFIIQALD